MLREGEGKEEEDCSIFQSPTYVMQWFETDIKIRIVSAIYF